MPTGGGGLRKKSARGTARRLQMCWKERENEMAVSDGGGLGDRLGYRLWADDVVVVKEGQNYE